MCTTKFNLSLTHWLLNLWLKKYEKINLTNAASNTNAITAASTTVQLQQSKYNRSLFFKCQCHEELNISLKAPKYTDKSMSCFVNLLQDIYAMLSFWGLPVTGLWDKKII